MPDYVVYCVCAAIVGVLIFWLGFVIGKSAALDIIADTCDYLDSCDVVGDNEVDNNEVDDNDIDYNDPDFWKKR